MPDDYKYQLSDKLGDAILVARGDDPAELVGNFGVLRETYRTELGGPQNNVRGPLTTPQQGVQNVQNGFPGAQRVGPPAPNGRPGHGEIFPGAACEDCGSAMKVSTGVSKAGNNYYVLNCTQNPKGHKPDWSKK